MSKSRKDSLGDRMKLCEQGYTGRRLLTPVCARIDGKPFSYYIRDLARPYDERLSHLMVDATKFLVE